jgi:glycerol-1-phosphatase
VTSSAVAAEQLAERLGPGAHVLVVGGAGLRQPLVDVGLVPVDDAAGAVAVVQGWAPTVDWAQLAEAAVVIRAGRPWLATNLDATLPSPRGPLPGNGSLVAALVNATGRHPESVGKPLPTMFTAAANRLGADRPLVVGDRLDTDIAGADGAGMPSLLVLTGVSSPEDLMRAPDGQRPTYLSADLRGLGRPHPAVERSTADAATCGAVTVTSAGQVRAAGAVEPMDGLRAACALAWSGALPPDRFAAVLQGLGLA